MIRTLIACFAYASCFVVLLCFVLFVASLPDAETAPEGANTLIIPEDEQVMNFECHTNPGQACMTSVTADGRYIIRVVDIPVELVPHGWTYPQGNYTYPEME